VVGRETSDLDPYSPLCKGKSNENVSPYNGHESRRKRSYHRQGQSRGDKKTKKE
jgi:hypothetical protein